MGARSAYKSYKMLSYAVFTKPNQHNDIITLFYLQCTHWTQVNWVQHIMFADHRALFSIKLGAPIEYIN